jgi:hypothetical protein
MITFLKNFQKTPEERRQAWEQAFLNCCKNESEYEEEKVRPAPKPDLLTKLHGNEAEETFARMRKHSRIARNRWSINWDTNDESEDEEASLSSDENNT